jgi:hypothetical protein
MPVSKESRLGLLIDAFKEWLPTVRERFNAWVFACMEEPSLIWQTNAIRYTTYVLGALLLAWIGRGAIHAVQPGGASPIPTARTADFRVICTNAACGHEFTIHRKFKFDDFPVVCPTCKQNTGQRGVRCTSAICRRRWVPAQVRDDRLVCPFCGATLGDGS